MNELSFIFEVNTPIGPKSKAFFNEAPRSKLRGIQAKANKIRQVRIFERASEHDDGQ
jgi:hypothetical protein